MTKAKKSRYIPITQQPMCCVAACVQMVLIRRKLPIISQEEIAYELGLIVPEKLKKILPGARTGEKPVAGWGTQEDKFTINNFFKKHNIPLKREYFQSTEIEDVRKWINDQIKKDNDILVCFDYGQLYDKHPGGHVCIVDSVSGNNITLVDPEYNVPKFRTVELNKLLKSMKHHKSGAKGFWVIERK